MARENIAPKFSQWTRHQCEDLNIGTDGYSAAWTADSEDDYMYLKYTQDVAGKQFKFGFASFTSSDNLAKIQIRCEGPDGTNTKLVDLTNNFPNPEEFDFTCTADCVTLRIYIRHEYSSQPIDPPASMTISGIYLNRIQNISYTAVNFHKVLESNLPTTVDSGTEHVYYTTDGSTVRMYISTKEGKLIPVNGGPVESSGKTESSYTNAYTQQWIDERKDEIVALTKQGHCIVFAVATDIHVRIEDGDAGRYNQVRDYIMLSEQLPIDYICCCGDIMSYCQDWDEVFEPRIEKVKTIFNQLRCPWFATRGNHDYNSDDNNTGNNPNIKEFDKTTADTYLTTNDIWHRSVTSQFPLRGTYEIVFDRERPTYGYFYVDDYAKKHRLIFTNSEETHETELGRPYLGNYEEPDCFISGAAETKHQITWLVNQAMDMAGKTDWAVSFYSHTVPYTDRDEESCHEFHGYGWNGPELRKIVKAFQDGTGIDMKYGCADVDSHTWVDLPIKKDFSAQGPIAVLGWFGGHCHDDCYKKVDGLNVTISTCTCASRRDRWSQDPDTPKLPPERNTTNYAMSVNVFVVNRDTRTINMIKLGSKRDNTVKTSSDLTFTY